MLHWPRCKSVIAIPLLPLPLNRMCVSAKESSRTEIRTRPADADTRLEAGLTSAVVATVRKGERSVRWESFRKSSGVILAQDALSRFDMEG